MTASARDTAAATPASRDRYVDLLRVASLGVVVLGHWLMAAVSGDGVGNLLAGRDRHGTGRLAPRGTVRPGPEG
ncbi:hypothetical protein BGK67_14130 [Streptomyces subrutilus]|uniref:Acyltransferase n=1 Tax=Streptomyces subrutilus TaxID=36818 RepID=A0A1E5PS32_9ACTN|nr:hypothetical protein BGK67_14130 [Streptomyces subrutilus]